MVQMPRSGISSKMCLAGKNGKTNTNQTSSCRPLIKIIKIIWEINNIPILQMKKRRVTGLDNLSSWSSLRWSWESNPGHWLPPFVCHWFTVASFTRWAVFPQHTRPFRPGKSEAPRCCLSLTQLVKLWVHKKRSNNNFFHTFPHFYFMSSFISSLLTMRLGISHRVHKNPSDDSGLCL